MSEIICGETIVEPEAYLKVITNNVETDRRTIHLKGKEVTFGRALKNDVVISLIQISGQHCIFSYSEQTNKWSVQDISLNGITVNGKRVVKLKFTELAEGDLVGLSPLGIYQFHEVDGDARERSFWDKSRVSASSSEYESESESNSESNSESESETELFPPRPRISRNQNPPLTPSKMESISISSEENSGKSWDDGSIDPVTQVHSVQSLSNFNKSTTLCYQTQYIYCKQEYEAEKIKNQELQHQIHETGSHLKAAVIQNQELLCQLKALEYQNKEIKASLEAAYLQSTMQNLSIKPTTLGSMNQHGNDSTGDQNGPRKIRSRCSICVLHPHRQFEASYSDEDSECEYVD